MTEGKKHIIFLGETRFPYGLASVQRTILMSKALISAGANVTVICRKGVWRENEHPDINYKGKYEGINYLYSSKTTVKPNGFLKRNLTKLKGIYGEYQFIKKLKKNKELSLAIVSERNNIHILRYYMYSLIFGFPIVNNLVEMASSFQNKISFLKRINNYVLDKWTLKLFSGALPISDKLNHYYRSIIPSKPSLKLPILCDYEKFEIPRENKAPYFLYCGSINYLEVINFILKCYKNLEEGKAKLYMVVSGDSKEKIQEIQDKINNEFVGAPVTLFTRIPYSQLVHLYTHAIALLIPLRPTLQDTSRFPHKIGEYLASGNPVITTNVGEIKTYFKDNETALVASEYKVSDFTEKMEYVLNFPEKAKSIGHNGKELGLRNFDYKIHGSRLLDFFDSKYNLK